MLKIFHTRDYRRTDTVVRNRSDTGELSLPAAAVPRWGQEGGTGPQIVANPQNLAVLDSLWSTASQKKTGKFDTTSRQIF